MHYPRMLVRVSSSVVRLLFVFLALISAVGFAYSGIRNALAQHQAGLNTREGFERAIVLETDDARNWYLLGRYWQYSLDFPDARRAISDYQRALSLEPSSADAWSDLAAAYETESDLSAARDAFLHAQQAYPQSPQVAWRYGNFLLRRGDTDSAFSEIKEAVARDPKLGAAALALALRVQPDFHIALDRVIPPSAQAFLSVVDSLSDQHQTDEALVAWSRLAALSPHFPMRESFPLTDALLQKRQVADAQRVWNDALAFAAVLPPPGEPGSLIWDGGFESDVRDGGFAWRFPSVPLGVQITLDRREKHSGARSVRLAFDGLRNVDFHDLCAFVAVQPSTSYLFSAWARTDSLSTDQGVRFALTPVGDSRYVESFTPDVRGSQPWTQLSFAWNSPPDAHALQICVTRRPSAKFDSKIRGLAWLDDLALVPQSAEPAPQ